SLRIVVNGEDIEQALPRGGAALANLREQPGQVVSAAMIVAVREDTPAVQAAVLLVVPAVEVPAPAPLFRPDDERRGIDRFDLRREIDHAIPDLIHRRADGTHITVGRVPQARLVVQNVVAQAAGCVRSPASDDMLYPA